MTDAMSGLVRTILCAAIVGSCGCSLKSRWAMSDPVYAEKYADGAEKWDLLGKAKQALDARHTEDLDGLYVGGGVQMRDGGNVLGGAEVGWEAYWQNWLTGRAALGIYGNEGEGYGGLDLGLRVQSPTRVAPFVGVGLFNGGSKGVEEGTFIDEDGFVTDERSTLDGWITAVYPEIGLHAWINGNWRVSGFGRYFVTTHGRDDDHWLVGFQVSRFTRGPTPVRTMDTLKDVLVPGEPN